MSEPEFASASQFPWINVHIFCASGFDNLSQSQMDAVQVDLES
ncbi:MAG TPA: hypothetical protein VEX86_26505 [Longimicrobium sp.]|nr:hypothetical protein [Longimicrobium sp.]